MLIFLQAAEVLPIFELVIAGHGDPGEIVLGDPLSKNSTVIQPILAKVVAKGLTTPATTFLTSLSSYLGNNATVEFVTCDSGEGATGQALGNFLCNCLASYPVFGSSRGR
jgi:hypothetical protein